MDGILLSEATPGKTYTVRDIKDEARLVNRLSSMGLMCGSQIDVCQNYKKQPVLVFSRDTLVAIGRAESQKIIVGGLQNE
ncbi:FeoA family protein [Jutongia sp.]